MNILNLVCYLALWLECILIAILLFPVPNRVSDFLARNLTIADPSRFRRRYGTGGVGILICLIVLAAVQFCFSFKQLGVLGGLPSGKIEDKARLFQAQRDLYLFGFALFNLYVLIGATVLRRRVADLLDERKGLLANEAPSEATRL
jgi:hypothetical protein